MENVYRENQGITGNDSMVMGDWPCEITNAH